jgi:hypothetical protein
MIVIGFIVTPFADHSFVLQALETLYIVKKIEKKKIFDDFEKDDEIE